MEVRSWVKTAALARSRAPLLKYGTTDDGLRQVAGELGVKWSAAMSALAATERLEFEAALPAVELQRFPLAAVEYADRLYRREPGKGKEEISKLIEGKITVAELKLLEALKVTLRIVMLERASKRVFVSPYSKEANFWLIIFPGPIVRMSAGKRCWAH